MQTEEPFVRLTIFIGESDQWGAEPLYHAIVQRARREGLAGATVLRGIEGYGANSRLHTASLLSLSDDLPLVIVIVDQASRIERFLPLLDELVGEGLVIREPVEVLLYRGRHNVAEDADAGGHEGGSGGAEEDPRSAEDER